MQSAAEILAGSAIEPVLDATEIEKAFMARQLVQCTLPHSNPGKLLPAWSRRNGTAVLSILPGRHSETGASFGYPYGSIPRLLLFWIVTETLRKKGLGLNTSECRQLELGDTLSEFMQAIGLNPRGRGKRSDAKRLHEQMRRLFRCELSLEETKRPGCERYRGMRIAEDVDIWWTPDSSDQPALWGNRIVLSEKFYRAIVAAPVPLDLDALRKLKRSPLALDLYALAAFKSYHANRLLQAQRIPWKGLLEQLGANYKAARMNNFRAKIKHTLNRVANAFPQGQLQIEYTEKGIAFLPGSIVPVPPTR